MPSFSQKTETYQFKLQHLSFLQVQSSNFIRVPHPSAGIVKSCFFRFGLGFQPPIAARWCLLNGTKRKSISSKSSRKSPAKGVSMSPATFNLHITQKIRTCFVGSCCSRMAKPFGAKSCVISFYKSSSEFQSRRRVKFSTKEPPRFEQLHGNMCPVIGLLALIRSFFKSTRSMQMSFEPFR